MMERLLHLLGLISFRLLEQVPLQAYLDGDEISANPKGPLLRMIGRTTGQLTFTSPRQAKRVSDGLMF
jgi:hypothetical protein